MSDSEDEYMCNNDDDYDMGYVEDDNSGADGDLENQYYIAKSIKEDDPEDSIPHFKKILDLEGDDKGEWGFKALKQMIEINFKLVNYLEMINLYNQLLTYIKSSVSRDYSEKVIISILDYISNSEQIELIQEFYETTLDALKSSKNDQLWFKTILKLGKLYLDQGKFAELSKILKELRNYCQNEDVSNDLKKGTQLLEIYALEIQMYTALNNSKKLRKVYEKSLYIKSAMPLPNIMGIVRECGGKINLKEGDYQKAHGEFFEAFKNYNESGSPKKISCLKYLVLVNMLMKSKISPFDSQEAKPYKNDPEILVMTTLLNAYQKADIKAFEKLLNDNRNVLMEDTLLCEHLEDLIRNIRKQVLIKLIKPYSRISLKFISNELKIESKEVENLLVICILEKSIKGFIDERNQVLVLNQHALGDARHIAIDQVTTQLSKIHANIKSKIV